VQKNILIFILIFILIINFVFAQENLIGYWSFNQEDRNSTHVFDLSGNENHGIIHGVTFINEPGSVNDSASFDGIDDYIEIFDNNNSLSGMKEFTISILIKRQILGNEIFLYKSSLWGTYSFRSWEIIMKPFFRDINGSYNNIPEGILFNYLDIYQYYSITYDGENCSQYINGNQVLSEKCFLGGLQNSSGKLFLGKGSVTDGYSYFNGEMDELFIYNRSFSQEEILDKIGRPQNKFCGNNICDEGENLLLCFNDCSKENYIKKINDNSDFSLFYTHSLIKIPLNITLSSYVKKEIPEIKMAKNEARFIQFIIKANKDQEIEFSVDTYPNIKTEFFIEEYINMTIPSKGYLIKSLPDPLLKRTSYHLLKDKMYIILLDITTNENTLSGENLLKVNIGNEKFDLKIKIYNFSIPKVVSLKTAFDSGHFNIRYTGVPGCNDAKSIFDFHNISTSNILDKNTIVRAYYDSYAENKIVPYRPHYLNEFYYNCTSKEMNFLNFDKTLEYYLDNLSMNTFMISHYSGSSGYSLCGLDLTQEGYYGIAFDYYTQIAEHLKEKGWLNKSYFMVDEPSGIFLDYTKNLSYFLTHEITPPLKIGPAMYKAETYDILNDSINLWIILNNERDSLSAYNPQKANNLRNQGDEIWWYYTKTDIFNIDVNSHENIVFGWLAWKYNITGILSWAGLIYDMHCVPNYHYKYSNPWDNPRSEWGNGQINFYYPPCKEGVCSEVNFEVIPSLRVKLFREGIQDYEYFKILEKLIIKADNLNIDTVNANIALARIDEVALSFNEWTNDPNLLIEIRGEIAQNILDLESRLSENFHEADLNKDGIISKLELLQFINLWKNGQKSINEVLFAINEWVKNK